MVSFKKQMRSSHVLVVKSHVRGIGEPYNATAATCGAMLNVRTYVSKDEYNRLSITDDTWYCNACTFNWISDSFFSDSTGDSLNKSTSSNFNTSEPGAVVDFKANVAAYYKFNLSIAHQNINSLQNKMLLNQELFDISVLTETKIDSTYNISLFQHSLYRIIRGGRKKGVGGIMVTSNIAFLLTDVNKESQWISKLFASM